MKIVECNPENIPAWIFPSAAAEWVYPETIADCLALGSGADIDKTSTDDWKSLLESIGWGRGRNAIEINGNGLENWVSIAQFFCYNGLTVRVSCRAKSTARNSNIRMEFEWDENKNQENIRRHGLNFEDAHLVFQRPVLRFLDDRKDYGEERWIGIGLLDGIRVVVVVFTEIVEDTIRIISMRKALTHERKRYEKAFGDQFGPI